MSVAEEQCPTRRQNILSRLHSLSENGLYFNGMYLPQEIVTLVLSYLDSNDLLQTSLVCRRWLNIVRSNTLWCIKFQRHFNKKPKKVPWYVYYAHFDYGFFDRNLIRNGNGQRKFEYWQIVQHGGNQFKVEQVPVGSDPLPRHIEDFRGYKSCFATSYSPCIKLQTINLPPLCRQILDVHKPHIYVSEWTAGRSDCGCRYRLTCSLHGLKEEVPPLLVENRTVHVKQWEGKEWSKVEMVLRDYPDGVAKIIFEHEGSDTQFWSGHYGSKMAGAVVKILFDTVKEVIDEDVAE